MVSKYEKNIEIQLMRIICITLTLIQHQDTLNTGRNFKLFDSLKQVFLTLTGVDIFFVISGYFMGYLVLGKSGNIQTLSEKVGFSIDFFKKRFLRLFPASFFWMTVALIICFIFPNDGLWITHLDIFYKWVDSIFYVVNIEDTYKLTMMGHYWSLSIENQFYIILPIVFFLLGKRYFIYALYGTAFLLFFWSPGGEQHWRWFRPMGFIWGLISYHITSIPEVSRVISQKAPKIPPMTSTILMVTTLIFVTTIPQSFRGHMLPFAFSIICMTGSLCLILSVLNCGTITVPHWLRPLCYWGGELTYSIYLCHIVVWMFLQALRQHYDWHISSELFTFVGMSAAIICAVPSYFLIERRFYKTKPIKQISN